MMARLKRLGFIGSDENSLDSILNLTVETFLDRRLQNRLVQNGMARSQHHARVLIKQRHIRVGKQVCNVAGMLVRGDNDKYIDFARHSVYGGGRPGRRKRKLNKSGGGGGGDDEDSD